MRHVSRALLLAAGLVLIGPSASFADTPFPNINYDYHDPNDLKATEPPGPNVAVDSTGDHLVYPGEVLDQARLNDPDEVKWPTLDKSVWEKMKGYYQITPRK